MLVACFLRERIRLARRYDNFLDENRSMFVLQIGEKSLIPLHEPNFRDHLYIR